jgi:hypothetical protein
MRAAATDIVFTSIEELPAIVSLSLFVAMIEVWAAIATHRI